MECITAARLRWSAMIVRKRIKSRAYEIMCRNRNKRCRRSGGTNALDCKGLRDVHKVSWDRLGHDWPLGYELSYVFSILFFHCSHFTTSLFLPSTGEAQRERDSASNLSADRPRTPSSQSLINLMTAVRSISDENKPKQGGRFDRIILYIYSMKSC